MATGWEGSGYDPVVLPSQTAEERRAKAWGGVSPDQEDEEARGEPVRRLKISTAADIEMEPVKWLWDTTPEGEYPTSHGRIPMNQLVIAAGGPGLGKSQFAAWMAARITTGRLEGQLFGKPRSVVYAASEDSWKYTIAPRLVAAGADLGRVLRVDVESKVTKYARLTLPLDTEELGRVAEEYSVGLFIADPLLSLLDSKVNDYKAADVREALEPLIECADTRQFTILGLAHFTKSGNADPLARLAGSGAFGQLIRAMLAFAKQEGEEGETEYVMSTAKNNLGRENLPSFSYDIQAAVVDTPKGPSYVSRFVLGAESSTSVKDVMRTEGDDSASQGWAAEWLHGYLSDAGGSELMREIKRAARKEELSDSAIDRAKRKLGIKSKQTGFGKTKGSTWFLPEAWEPDAVASMHGGIDGYAGDGPDLHLSSDQY